MYLFFMLLCQNSMNIDRMIFYSLFSLDIFAQCAHLHGQVILLAINTAVLSMPEMLSNSKGLVGQIRSIIQNTLSFEYVPFRILCLRNSALLFKQIFGIQRPTFTLFYIFNRLLERVQEAPRARGHIPQERAEALFIYMQPLKYSFQSSSV